VIYLSGAIRKKLTEYPEIGWMATPDMGNILPRGPMWAFDNACFKDPQGFNWERWEKSLRKRIAEAGEERLLFVVAPDIPFDAEGTVRRFAEYRDRLKALNLPVAFVTQDGMGTEDVPWADIDAVFVGGSTEWKTGHESGAIVTAARERGKWVHMGRVNSLKRLRVAVSMGCNSADGTFVAFGPDINIERLLGWLKALALEPLLRLEHAS
jgi:hypothetical protein